MREEEGNFWNFELSFGCVEELRKCMLKLCNGISNSAQKIFSVRQIKEQSTKAHVEENCGRFQNPCGVSYHTEPFKQSPKAFTQYPYHVPACNETTGREHYFIKALAVSISHNGSGKEFRGPDIAEESVSNFPLELHFQGF